MPKTILTVFETRCRLEATQVQMLEDTYLTQITLHTNQTHRHSSVG